jgi:tetratricopeptide (TPR) repeat protein
MTVLGQAADRLADVGSAVELAACGTEIARAWLLLGEPHRALERADEALARLGTTRGLEGAQAHLVRGRALYVLRRADEAAACYDAALQLAREAGASRQAAAVLREIGDTHRSEGRAEQAAKAYGEALDAVAVRPQVPGLAALAPSLRA